MSAFNCTDAEKFGNRVAQFVEKGGLFVFHNFTNCTGNIKDIGGAMEKYIPLKFVGSHTTHNAEVHDICNTKYKKMLDGVTGSLGVHIFIDRQN
eukprot:UN26342